MINKREFFVRKLSLRDRQTIFFKNLTKKCKPQCIASNQEAHEKLQLTRRIDYHTFC